MATEVEARFSAAGPEVLRAIADLPHLNRADLGTPIASQEFDVYLDTVDGSLAAVRWACRLRTREDRVTLSLKGPPDPAVGRWLHRRPESEGPATAERDPAAWPASDARALLERLSGGAALVERFVLQQHRVERTVTQDGRRTGILTLDTVEVEHRGARVGRLHVVELELTAGTDDETILRPLAEELERMTGLTPEPRTKLERALELIGGR